MIQCLISDIFKRTETRILECTDNKLTNKYNSTVNQYPIHAYKKRGKKPHENKRIRFFNETLIRITTSNTNFKFEFPIPPGA